MFHAMFRIRVTGAKRDLEHVAQPAPTGGRVRMRGGSGESGQGKCPACCHGLIARLSAMHVLAEEGSPGYAPLETLRRTSSAGRAVTIRSAAP